MINVFLISFICCWFSSLWYFISVLCWLVGLHCELDISRLDTSCCLHQTRNQTQLLTLLSRSQKASQFNSVISKTKNKPRPGGVVEGWIFNCKSCSSIIIILIFEAEKVGGWPEHSQRDRRWSRYRKFLTNTNSTPLSDHITQHLLPVGIFVE